jgi:hypothetical protein
VRIFAALGMVLYLILVRAMGDINKQADAFVKFNLSNNKMRRALINKDWATFASVYNGSTYYRYNYDRRIKANYEKIIMNTFIQNPPAKNDIDAAFLRTAWSQRTQQELKQRKP